MHWLLKVLLAVLVGVLVTALLEYWGVLNHTLDVLLGIIVAIVVYFSPLPA